MPTSAHTSNEVHLTEMMLKIFSQLTNTACVINFIAIIHHAMVERRSMNESPSIITSILFCLGHFYKEQPWNDDTSGTGVVKQHKITVLGVLRMSDFSFSCILKKRAPRRGSSFVPTRHRCMMEARLYLTVNNDKILKSLFDDPRTNGGIGTREVDRWVR